MSPPSRFSILCNLASVLHNFYTISTGFNPPSTTERSVSLWTIFQRTIQQLISETTISLIGIEQIHNFEEQLDDEHEVSILLTSFGTAVTMNVTNIGYQNPDLLYFHGFVNGKLSTLVQYASQLNFLITSIERPDKTKPVRRIGFQTSKD